MSKKNKKPVTNVVKIRRRWRICPVERVKESDKVYDRKRVRMERVYVGVDYEA